MGMRRGQILLFLFLSVVSPRSHLSRAQDQPNNARQTLKQSVVDLQKNPDDQSLRERIIKLAQELKPAPAIPEEARRHYVKGDALIHDAKSPQEAGVAVEEYNKALLEAPWWPEAYRDLGVALEVAGRYDDAKKALKLYLLSHPGEDDSRKAQDEIYRVEAKEESATRKQREEEAAKARDRDRQAEEHERAEKARRQSVEGKWAWPAPSCDTPRQPESFEIFRDTSGRLVLALRGMTREMALNPGLTLTLAQQYIEGRDVRFNTEWGAHASLHYVVSLSADSTKLTGRREYWFDGRLTGIPQDLVFCRVP